MVERLHGRQVWRVALNSRKGNVMDWQCSVNLHHDALDALEGDNRCNLLVLQGAGRHIWCGVSAEDHRDVSVKSHDGREGVNAFFEKRSSVWADE